MDERKKPWYFVAPVLSLVLNKVSDYIIEALLPPEKVDKVLNNTISISIKSLVFILITFVLIIYCILRYGKERKHRINVESRKVENILKKMEYVESIQVYRYELMDKHNCKQIKVDFTSGSAKQDIDINSVLQSYYCIPYSIFKKANTFGKNYSNYLANDNLENKEIAINIGKELCTEIIESLNKICGVEDISDYHYEMYRILSAIMPAIDSKGYHSFLENAEVEKRLTTGKRTGLIGPIILNGLYVFKNHNSFHKNGRLYVAFPLERDSKLIVLASINNNYFETIETADMKCYYNEIMKLCNEAF